MGDSSRLRACDIILYIIALALVGFIIFCSVKLTFIAKDYAAADTANEEMQDEYVAVADVTDAYQDDVPDAQDTVFAATEQAADAGLGSDPGMYVEPCPLDVDFQSLLAQNDEVVAWLYCPGTKVNYPVAQATNNSKYLHTLLNGRYSVSGTLFMDCTCGRDFSSKNVVIYGHNMRNKTFFGILPKFGGQSYFNAHRTWWVSTPARDYKVEMFAAYTVKAGTETYRTEFADDAAFNEWVSNAKRMSDVWSDTEVTAQDQILTLSTCVYDYNKARYVLQGKLMPVN